MDVLMKEEYTLRLTKREFTLVTKGLVGKLSSEPCNGTDKPEVEEARELGLHLIDRARARAEEKTDALEHAWRRASAEHE